MRYTTTDGPKKPLNAIQEGSLGGKMGIADTDILWRAATEDVPELKKLVQRIIDEAQ